VLVFGVALFALGGCSDRGAEPDAGGLSYLLFQVPGCGTTGSARIASSDSCFTYSFDGVLDLSWCVPANCCPDSNRFALSSIVVADTILVAVRDTAQRLCRCICSYNIHARYVDLPLDQYHFLVQYEDSVFYREIIYRRR
jgi:hypothetical protein